MAADLAGLRIAALVASGFEQSELLDPKRTLEAAGARVDVISPQPGTVKGWNHGEWGERVKVDRPLGQAKPDDYDGLLLPGGVMNPDRLRIDEQAVRFVSAFVESGRPIAAICHGPWTLIEAGGVRGRRLTSWSSLRTDLTNAGATWVDEEVVEDHGLVTSRKPADIPAFSRKAIEVFSHAMAGRRR
ncbi:MAG: type 1 glutamine amidotransferase [Acidobacteria bacterium]|nr:type 1 glutamine amidotransferase [Acidobacteriota bacterium]